MVALPSYSMPKQEFPYQQECRDRAGQEENEPVALPCLLSTSFPRHEAVELLQMLDNTSFFTLTVIADANIDSKPGVPTFLQ